MATPAPRSSDSEGRKLTKQDPGIGDLVQRMIDLDQQADRRRRRQEMLSRLWRSVRSLFRRRSASSAGGGETGGYGRPEAWPEPRQAGEWRAPGPARQAGQRARADSSEPVSQAMARLEDRIRNLPPRRGEAFENAVRKRFETDKKFQDKFQEHPERYPTFAKYLNKATVAESVRMAPPDPPRGKERAEVLGALTPEERAEAERAEALRGLGPEQQAEALEAQRRSDLAEALRGLGPEQPAEVQQQLEMTQVRTPQSFVRPATHQSEPLASNDFLPPVQLSREMDAGAMFLEAQANYALKAREVSPTSQESSAGTEAAHIEDVDLSLGDVVTAETILAEERAAEREKREKPLVGADPSGVIDAQTYLPPSQAPWRQSSGVDSDQPSRQSSTASEAVDPGLNTPEFVADFSAARAYLAAPKGWEGELSSGGDSNPSLRRQDSTASAVSAVSMLSRSASEFTPPGLGTSLQAGTADAAPPYNVSPMATRPSSPTENTPPTPKRGMRK